MARPRRTTGAARAAAVLTAAAAVVVAATGCAGPSPHADAPAVAVAHAPDQHAPDQHASDVAYAQAMIPHVAQGVELTDMVAARVANPSLAQLCQSMNHTDAEEQGQLTGQLHLWDAPVPGEDGVPLATMPGMADAATLDRLRSMSGPAFDRAWLAVMLTHHQGGVDMSRTYLTQGAGPALETLAQTQVQVGADRSNRCGPS